MQVRFFQPPSVNAADDKQMKKGANGFAHGHACKHLWHCITKTPRTLPWIRTAKLPGGGPDPATSSGSHQARPSLPACNLSHNQMRRFSQSLLHGFLLLYTIIQLAHAESKSIVIGQAIDLSGPAGVIGRDYVAGITTYFDSLNASGGINGHKIKYLVRDDLGDPRRSSKAVTELINSDRIDYLIGGIGAATTDAVVATPAFVRSGFQLFAPMTESPRNYGERVVFWRPGPEQEMHYIFSYFDKLGIRSIGIAVEDLQRSQEMYQYVAAEAKRRSMTLAGTAHISSSPVQVEKEAATLAASNPNIVIVIGDGVSAGVFLKAFRRHAERTFVAGTSLVNLETLAEMAGPKSLEWTVFSQVVPNPAGKQSKVQLDHIAMMKRFRDEALSAATLEGYLAAKTLCRAIQASGVASQALQQFTSRTGVLDLGGFVVNPSAPNHHMSSYVDIALFRKGGNLMY
ncbi:ABC transporter substrate-binding protein [Noviherbaspirillum pedocola]|uniref:ABC transporter substrate-binding protein n=1 Tax=Noviherbaspirillum pedocola TaxID=2801341 RepID=A0A934SX49_9BURK|nr:ABC transporter substrate-binding protein [Noviherbaspirillum pedocola]MBK4737269.1 ABC transporter substrate-binding protein [Noviherbaspirillum pedocola]